MEEIKNTKKLNNPLIPDGWTVSLLGDLGTFSKGKGILKEQVVLEGLPCIRYGEIYTTHDFIIKNFKSFICDDVAAESKEIKNGDILFAGSGETVEEIGKAVAYVGNEKAYAGGDVIILSTKKNVNPECLSYALETDFVKMQKRVLGQGNSVVHIYSSDLSKVKIPLPPLHEQKAIAQVLSAADAAIHTTEKLIAQKELRKKWLMQQLLTGKKRLLNDEWKPIRIGDVFKFIKSYSISREGLQNDNEGSVFCIHYGDIHAKYDSSFLDFERQKNIPQLIDENISIEEGNYLQDGDIVMADASEDYEGVGVAVEVKNLSYKKAIGGLHTLVLRADKKTISPDFAAYFFSSEKVRNTLRKYATGTSVYSVTKTQIHNLSFIIPNSLKEQTAIAQVLQVADKEIGLLKVKAEKLREQKKGLMQVLLTGKVRLKTN